MSFNPPDPIDLSGGYADVSALLQLLIDPVKTKERLDELVSQQKLAEEKIAELNAMASETRRLHTTAQATGIMLENRKAALDARELEIEQKADELAKSESTRSDAALRRRENAVESRESAARSELDRLAVMRKELEAKLGKIKNLTSSLG